MIVLLRQKLKLEKIRKVLKIKGNRTTYKMGRVGGWKSRSLHEEFWVG